MGRIDGAFWKGKKVLVTGHTGFKGAWLSLWLQELGAQVVGISNGVPTKPSLYRAVEWGDLHLNVESDIRDRVALSAIIAQTNPEIIFHLAAQSLVRPSYQDPVGTFSTNIMGTLNIFECARSFSSVRAVINVTSDKCYENHEGDAPYRESDRLGGRDPYSCSKACSELITTAYQRSFFIVESSTRKVGLASVRAGNVIGGGDWSADRLIPDCVRAFSKNESVLIRNPESTRPWQHVLDAARGYLLTAQALFKDPVKHSEAYNFGPDVKDATSVSNLLGEITKRWGAGAAWSKDEKSGPHESVNLSLDSSYAREKLGWAPLLSISQSLDLTVAWYKAFQTGGKMTSLSQSQIKHVASLES
jgi:CDP-glucose 4,6-dehydratase